MTGIDRVYKPGFWARLILSENWKLTINASVHDRISCHIDKTYDLPCLDLVSISTIRGLLWHTVEIRSKEFAFRLSGLSAESANEMANGVLAFVNRYLSILIEEDEGQLSAIDQRICQVTEESRQYLAQADIAEVISQYPGNASKALSHPLFYPSIMPASLRARLPRSLGILIDPQARRQYNDKFVVNELARYNTFFDDLGGICLSDEQREACIRLENNNLLVASAGSGKSATMVGKVSYVLEKKLYEPEQILVLAYNRSAGAELRARIARQLQVEEGALGCRVTTFHALGRGIIQQTDGKPPQLANWAEHPAGEARVIDQLIQNLSRTDPDFHRLWMELLTIFQQADIPPELFDSDDDHERYSEARASDRSVTIGTLAGLFVNSLQEQRIVNWLWINSVQFEYERQTAVHDEDGTIRYLHPDFYYPSSRTVHEHFAINADGTSPFKDYVAHAQSKRQAYRRENMDFFETTSAQVSNGTLIEHLAEELRKRDIPTEKRSFDEIMKALEPAVIRHYHNIIAVCIKHIRASQLSLEMLRERAKSLSDKPRAKRFVEVVWKIARAYANKLDEEGRIDFDSMIGDAIRLVETGRYKSPYALILVDEFQDISGPRANLIKALKHQRPFTKMFAVGDDWQSIYRFAGSDISIFTHFETNFGASWQGRLEQTYRCNQLLAETAAKFVQKNPDQLKKTVRSTRPAIPRSIRVVPVQSSWKKPGFDMACDKVLSRLNLFLGQIADQWRTEPEQKLTVLVLWRYNNLNPFKGRMPTYPNIEVNAMSFHRAKGLEADYTILLDVSEGDYGVPSRIEDDELLNLVIPMPENYSYAEERRLFYVALTRASRGTYLLANARKPSRYIRELWEIAGHNVRFETIDGDELALCPACMLGQMVERQGPEGSYFFGCTEYPSCRHTRPIN